jgi:hypothetical protein
VHLPRRQLGLYFTITVLKCVIQQIFSFAWLTEQNQPAISQGGVAGNTPNFCQIIFSVDCYVCFIVTCIKHVIKPHIYVAIE